LRDRGCDEETIHVVLLEVNRLRCEPPLEDAEVHRIAKSVSRYPSGSLRYRKSSATRIYRNGKAD
jgi:putative DNA primase/helicase